jgi:hypothetical protein
LPFPAISQPSERTWKQPADLSEVWQALSRIVRDIDRSTR